jgi:hypothetical protein
MMRFEQDDVIVFAQVQYARAQLQITREIEWSTNQVVKHPAGLGARLDCGPGRHNVPRDRDALWRVHELPRHAVERKIGRAEDFVPSDYCIQTQLESVRVERSAKADRSRYVVDVESGRRTVEQPEQLLLEGHTFSRVPPYLRAIVSGWNPGFG